MKTDAPVATSLPERDLLCLNIPFYGTQVALAPANACRLIFRVNMHNDSGESLRLIGRRWRLKDDDGNTYQLEAEGVFNQQPVLRPGEVFSYCGSQIFTPRPPKSIELRFFGTDHSNRPFITPPLKFPRKCFNEARGNK